MMKIHPATAVRAALSCALVLEAIFVATMLIHYRSIDVAYLLQATLVILTIAGVSGLITSVVFRAKAAHAVLSAPLLGLLLAGGLNMLDVAIRHVICPSSPPALENQ